MTTHANLPYKLIVFDWDGTIMDSAAQIVASIKAAAHALSLPEPTDEAARDVIGLGLEQAIAKVFPEASDDAIDKLVDGYRKNYKLKQRPDSDVPASLFAGAEDTLRTLHKQGYWLAVATGKSRRGLNAVLETTGLSDLFITTRCADETFSKPHPQMMLDILDYCGLEPAQALMVGDTEYDMQMAVSAGSHALGVGCGVHSVERILAAGAKECLADVAAVPQWLANVAAG